MIGKKNIKRLYNAVIIVLILCGAGYVCSRFLHLGDVEYTDDARIHRHMSPVNTRVQGFVRKICFEEYQHVNKGDTLVIIEDAEYRYMLAQAEADLAKALSGKSADAAGLRTNASNVTVVSAGIEEAEVNLKNAKSDFDRYAVLLKKDAVTKQQYDDMETRYKAAKARYEQVMRQKKSTELAGNEQEGRLGQSSAVVRLAEAAVELAKLKLSYTVILAPCDGYTGSKDIHAGQLVQPGQLMVNIVDDGDVWVTADYRETQLKHIKEGDSVKIKADAVPDVVFTGHVEAVSYATGAAWSGIPVQNTSGNFVKVEQRVPVRIRIDGIVSNKSGQSDEAVMSGLISGLNVQTEVCY